MVPTLISSGHIYQSIRSVASQRLEQIPQVGDPLSLRRCRWFMEGRRKTNFFIPKTSLRVFFTNSQVIRSWAEMYSVA
jgi:hypothetical protein